MSVEIQPTMEQLFAQDGRALRVALFQPPFPVLKGVIQLVHGFGEGIEHYDELACDFAMQGYLTVVHDQRGFGKEVSKKERGIVASYEVLLTDLQVVSGHLQAHYSELPLFLYGFSMGGNIALNLVLRDPFVYEKCVVVAPWLANHKPLQKGLKWSVDVLGKLSPRLRIRTFLRPTHISRNVGKLLHLRQAGVFHDILSLRLFSQILHMSEQLMLQASRLSTPTLVIMAGRDKIVCNHAIRQFLYQSSQQVRYHVYEEGYHCLHFEPERTQLVKDVLVFFTA